MGVINVTPDSFSGDGLFAHPDQALRRAVQLVADGADMLDIGGESTRPGFKPVSAKEQLRRVLPVIRAVVKEVVVPISIDTRNAEVARKSLEAGASIINDVSGLSDPDMISVARQLKCGIVLMHQVPITGDPIEAITAHLRDMIDRVRTAGIRLDKITVDPGFGFNKSWQQNLEVLDRLDELVLLGVPVLVGPSRKGTIGRVLGIGAQGRLEGTIALSCVSAVRGASVLRVHDVKEVSAAIRMIRELIERRAQ